MLIVRHKVEIILFIRTILHEITLCVKIIDLPPQPKMYEEEYLLTIGYGLGVTLKDMSKQCFLGTNWVTIFAK